jgi:hypothetical protein
MVALLNSLIVEWFIVLKIIAENELNTTIISSILNLKYFLVNFNILPQFIFTLSPSRKFKKKRILKKEFDSSINQRCIFLKKLQNKYIASMLF